MRLGPLREDLWAAVSSENDSPYILLLRHNSALICNPLRANSIHCPTPGLLPPLPYALPLALIDYMPRLDQKLTWISETF